MHIGTLTARTRAFGLLAGLKELAALEPRGLVLEAPGPEADLPRAMALLREWKVDVVAGVAPLVRRGPAAAAPAGLLSESETVRAAAREGVGRTIRNLGQLHCGRCVLPFSEPLFEVDAALRGKILAGGDEATMALGAWRAAHAREREQAAERLCRELFGIAREHSRVSLLLAPGSDPLDPIDLEVLGWVLDELPSGSVGIAFSTGALGLRTHRGDGRIEEWAGALRPRLGLLLWSDHDASMRDDLLFGTGQLDSDALRSALELGGASLGLGSLASAVMPDPELEGLPFLREAVSNAERCARA